MEISENNYINIQGWMITRLKLKGNELMIYAMIHGFSQDGNSRFHGSVKYLMAWTGLSKQTVITVIQSLISKSYITQVVVKTKGSVKYCEYYTAESRKNIKKDKESSPDSSKKEGTYQEKNTSTGQEFRPANTHRAKNLTGTGQEFRPVAGQKNRPVFIADKLGTNSTTTASETDKTATVAINETLTQLFNSSSLFSADFVGSLSILLQDRSALFIRQYLEFVYSETEIKDPKDFNGYFYKTASQNYMLTKFITMRQENEQRNLTSQQQSSTIQYKCPACGFERKNYTDCPQCGLDCREQDDTQTIHYHSLIAQLCIAQKKDFIAALKKINDRYTKISEIELRQQEKQSLYKTLEEVSV